MRPTPCGLSLASSLDGRPDPRPGIAPAPTQPWPSPSRCAKTRETGDARDLIEISCDTMGCKRTATSAVPAAAGARATRDWANQLNRLYCDCYAVNSRRLAAGISDRSVGAAAAPRGPEDMEIKVCPPADFPASSLRPARLAKSSKSSPRATNFRESLAHVSEGRRASSRAARANALVAGM